MCSQGETWPAAMLLKQTAEQISSEARTGTGFLSGPRMLTLWVLLSLLPGAAQQVPRSEVKIRPQAVTESYGKLPMSFEANRGQTDARVKFLSRGLGYTLFLTGDAAAVFSLHGQEANAVLRMKLGGASAHAGVTGAAPLPGKSNYFIGKDPRQWRTNVPTYAAVKYTAVYPGIDLVYHGNQRLLEYDFVVAPGTDPRVIDIGFQGARKLSVNGDGALVIGVGGSEVIEHAPVVYQEIGGKRQTVAGRYVLRGKGRVGFSVAEYDRSQPLVIDPVLVYSTYLGSGNADVELTALAVDASGNAYVTGSTGSPDFPVTPGAFQTTLGNYWSAFVTKLNATGSALVYSTFLGGGYGNGIAVDASGNAYVTGSTASPDFPVTPGAFQTSCGSGGFVTKLNAAGSALIYSTCLKGVYGGYIAIDDSGSAYITGDIGYSADFVATPGAFATTCRYNNVFVTKLNAAGSALAYSACLGGNLGMVSGGGIAVDASRNAYVTGATSSTDFPVTPGALRTTLEGDWDSFVTKLNAAGSALIYSTFLGGNGSESIALDPSGNAYVTVGTGDGCPSFCGDLVTKLNAAGAAIVYSTNLGPSWGTGIAVDASGSAYVTGYSFSGFPTTPDAFQTTFGGGEIDAFVAKLNAGGSILYSSYLGGRGQDHGSGIAVDASGNAYVTGITASPDFPVTPGAFETTFGPLRNCFVSKLSPGASPGPVSTANLNGPSGDHSWYMGPVTVMLIATPDKSPISATYYSIDNGPYQGYGGPFSISADGVHLLLFYSVDTAGRQETPRGQAIRIDATKPVSRVGALPTAVTSPNFSVQWSGADATSGVWSYTIYVSDNGGAFTPWLLNTTLTQAYYSGSLLHSYAFYSIATDVAGNMESKTVVEATTYVPQISGDVNHDGLINCADLALVKASFGKSAGQTGFNPDADVNNDGVVNVLDLAIVSQKLAPGTRCP